MNTPNPLLLSLYQRLQKVCWFSYRAAPGAHSKTGWQGHGEGQLQYESTAAYSCYIKEHGLFYLKDRSTFPVRNEWLWQFSSNSVTLSHVRQGRDQPVQLFKLTPGTLSETLITEAPHECGQDNYAATLTLQEDGFDMKWTINGPKKHEHIDYCYRSSPAKKAL